MNHFALSIVLALSMAGSAFVIGITLGWIMALVHFGSISSKRNSFDKED